jgi:hypothetical protein
MAQKRVHEHASQSASPPSSPTLPYPKRIKVAIVNDSVDCDAPDRALPCSARSQSTSLAEVSLALMPSCPHAPFSKAADFLICDAKLTTDSPSESAVYVREAEPSLTSMIPARRPDDLPIPVCFAHS